MFLTEKLKQNEEVIKLLQKDVFTLKQKLMIEMSINEKKGSALKVKDAELSELRTEHISMETTLRKELNEKTVALEDKTE